MSLMPMEGSLYQTMLLQPYYKVRIALTLIYDSRQIHKPSFHISK